MVSAAFYTNKTKNDIFFTENRDRRWTAANPPPGSNAGPCNKPEPHPSKTPTYRDVIAESRRFPASAVARAREKQQGVVMVRRGGGPVSPSVDLAYPFEGRWLTQNSPANRVPSHGTTLLATSFAIDFVPVDEHDAQRVRCCLIVRRELLVPARATASSSRASTS